MNGVAITADMRVLVSAHLKRGATFLANATTAAELLEASAAYSAAYDEAKRLNRLAAAKGAHDEVIANIHRAQAEALEGEASAKRLLADAYDAAQPKEARLGGRPKTVPDGNGFTAAEAGLSRKTIHEARIIRDAEVAHPGIVKETIEAAVAAGEEPTRAKVRRATLHVVRPDHRRDQPSPLRGKAAAIKAVTDALAALSGLPNADEVVGYFRGTDAACLVDERIGPASRWLAEFAEIWSDNANS